MDIFELAQQGMEIQEEEIKEKLLAEKEIAEKKAYKFNIFEALDAASKKDYQWLENQGENKKGVSAFMINRWLCMLWNKVESGKKFTNNDISYVGLLNRVNKISNVNLFATNNKDLYWLLVCTIQQDALGNPPFNAKYIKLPSEIVNEAYNPKVINYISQQLYSSKEKIISMIEAGLITNDDMIAIEKDFETLEKPKKK